MIKLFTGHFYELTWNIDFHMKCDIKISSNSKNTPIRKI